MSASTVHGRLLETLGMEITGGRYAAGAVLRLEDLGSRFAASRTIVREAIRVLESMHLVASRRRVGITIQDRQSWNVFDPQVIRWRLAGDERIEQLCSLTELRQAIEPMAARAAAVNADDTQRVELIRLSELLVRTGHAGDLAAFLAHDIAFHQLILVASGNEMFASLAGTVAEVLTGRTMYQLMPSRPRPVAVKWHRQVATAIRAGNAPAAEAAMRAITDEVKGQWKRLSALHASGGAPATWHLPGSSGSPRRIRQHPLQRPPGSRR